MNQPAVELLSLRKAFDDAPAVDDLSLTIPPGLTYGLLGPNGAGKTTTIRMLMDIIGPDEGEVRVFGHRRTRSDLERIGYLPEERGLYRKMTVKEQLVFLGELHGLRRTTLNTRADEWLARVDLASRAKSKVEELSKGMQQKIQLAGALIHEPELLVLDEPFSGLDPINQELFREVLTAHKRAGKTILFSTHVMEQAEKLCDHIALIARGRLVLCGDLAVIKRQQGENSYRVVADGDVGGVRALPGVTSVVAENGSLRIHVESYVEAGQLLRQLVSFLEVRDFRFSEPSLEEIFVKVVRDVNN